VSKFNKLEKRLRRRPAPSDIKFSEIHRLLIGYGFSCQEPSSGSHYVYTHSELNHPLPIPRNSQVKIVYVREAIKAIDKIKEIQGR